jgi:hypothetical protein
MFEKFCLLRLSGINLIIAPILLSVVLLCSCSRRNNQGADEQIRMVSPVETGDSFNSVDGSVSLKDIASYPQKVILTGLKEHRLVTVYKQRKPNLEKGSGSLYSRYYYYDDDEYVEHFMPGIDLIYGYNLINVAYSDLKNEQPTFLFNHPVLVKSLYYPSFVQDSIDKKPVTRDYYLVSVYDEDTNADTLINRRDLRRFYHFNASCTSKTRLIPGDYSVERSQYDKGNDFMYIFARHDADANGKSEPTEPLHIFWIDLRSPATAKRLY